MKKHHVLHPHPQIDLIYIHNFFVCCISYVLLNNVQCRLRNNVIYWKILFLQRRFLYMTNYTNSALWALRKHDTQYTSVNTIHNTTTHNPAALRFWKRKTKVFNYLEFFLQFSLHLLDISCFCSTVNFISLSASIMYNPKILSSSYICTRVQEKTEKTKWKTLQSSEFKLKIIILINTRQNSDSEYRKRKKKPG